MTPEDGEARPNSFEGEKTAPPMSEMYTGISEIHSGIVYDTFHTERSQGIALHDEGVRKKYSFI